MPISDSIRPLMDPQQARRMSQYVDAFTVNFYDSSTIANKESKKTVAARIKAANKKEKENLEKFMATGQSDNLYAAEDGTIFIAGDDLKRSRVTFMMDKAKITANKERSKHLQPLLKELAKREGLELDVTGEELGYASARRVAYYAFKNRQMVDDTKLVSVARSKDWQRGHSAMPCRSCGNCGQDGCSECSYCDDCRPDEITALDRLLRNREVEESPF